MRVVRSPILGEPRYDSPLCAEAKRGGSAANFVGEGHFVRAQVDYHLDRPAEEELLFEKAGARRRIFFDPARTRAAIVTCGGLSPGLNNVIRSVFLELTMNYGVPEVLGIRYGYQGLNPKQGREPLRLTLSMVEGIHQLGGTILGTSRGSQDPAVMADFLADRKIDILFCVGGDGTQRGAHALYEEITRRSLPIAIVGIPKTIDNDIAFCDRTFGFTTAVEEAERVIAGAHVEAKGPRYGIGLVKVMGREAGFIAAAATLASQEVNFTLIPEVPLRLDGPKGFLAALRRRMLEREHAVIVVAEGVGAAMVDRQTAQRDASGNVKLPDIGPVLKDAILKYFAENGPPVDVKYIDPSYVIRSVPANCEDDILCDQFGRRAVHAAMAGKTGVLLGHLSGTFVHVPIAMSVGQKRRVNVEGELWNAVLSATGQPRSFE